MTTTCPTCQGHTVVFDGVAYSERITRMEDEAGVVTTCHHYEVHEQAKCERVAAAMARFQNR